METAPVDKGGSMEFRPSLWAAVDVAAKIMGTVAGFAASILVPAAINGQPVGAAALFLGANAIGLYPAIAAAFLPAVQLAFTRYHLDDEGIVTRTQVLSKSEKRIPWEKITALRHRRTLLDVVFRLERVDVVAYGERGATIHLVGLKDARRIRDRVASEMRATASVESLFRGD